MAASFDRLYVLDGPANLQRLPLYLGRLARLRPSPGSAAGVVTWAALGTDGTTVKVSAFNSSALAMSCYLSADLHVSMQA